jgi:pyrroline-5-carboxylate reductase
MADAILGGAVASGVCRCEDICVYDISDEKVAAAKAKGFSVAARISDITQKCKYVLLSVKPQSADEVFRSIQDSLNDNIFITIMAGVTKGKIHKNLKNVKVCRCMPNTPALVGKGMTAIDAEEIEETNKNFIFKLFNSIGDTIPLSEAYMNAVTAVSGSGPAYVYKFINAFIAAAINLGLSAEQSKALVLSTVIGAATMVKQSETEISVLIDRVCSKGGTTIEGVKALDNGNFEKVINDCVTAAYKRAEELSKN